jgi:hypothetical protein
MDNAARENYSEFIDELGLTANASQLDPQDLAELIAAGDNLKSSGSWLIGDVSLMAKEMFGDEWYSHIPFTVSIRTCNNYSSIAKKFPRERRRKSLPFRYFDAVKALDPAEADEWLDKAERQEMSSDELRDALRDVATIEKRTVIGHVGSIDKLLTLDFGLPSGFEVKISYEVVLAAA